MINPHDKLFRKTYSDLDNARSFLTNYLPEQAISKETGEYIMTLAEKLHNEGKLEGLREAIELGITLKFPGDIDTVMARVNKIDDLDTLKNIKEAIKTAQGISEILALIK